MKPLDPNTILQDRYQLTRLIGKGGMGEVYLAVDNRLGHSVALKRTTVGDDPALGEAFEQEARTLAQLRHPALPKVSDHFVENGEQFLVMDYIEGEDLAKRLKSMEKPFPLNWVLFWADQLLEALGYMHKHDPPIIHRDIKPQNLKLTAEKQIILLDFGLSKRSQGQTKVTTSGSVVGYTPHYAPMEQIRGTGTNAASDIYSLSATLYQLLTATVPPDALTRADARLAGSADPIAPLTKYNDEISDNLSDIIRKGMELSQEQRYQTARDMQKDLRTAFNQLQESMSAETVAFNINDEDVGIGDAKTEVISDLKLDDVAPPTEDKDSLSQTAPPAVPSEKTADFSADKTEVISKADLPDSGANQEFQSTMKKDFYPPAEDAGPPKTEAFNADDLASTGDQSVFETSEEIGSQTGSSDFATSEDFKPEEEYKTSEDFSPSEEYSPEATVPLISLDEGDVASGAEPADSTDTAGSDETEEQPFVSEPDEPESEEADSIVPAAAGVSAAAGSTQSAAAATQFRQRPKKKVLPVNMLRSLADSQRFCCCLLLGLQPSVGM